MPATNKAIIELAREWDKAREQAALVQELKARTAAAAGPPPTDAPTDSTDDGQAE